MRVEFRFAKFEPRDIWVGVFWDPVPVTRWRKVISVYVCPIPMFVICFDVIMPTAEVHDG